MQKSLDTLRKHQSGFTLIELMITVAIVAVLMAVALPAYQNYTIRSRVSEGLYFADAAKISVADVATSGYNGGDGYSAGFPALDPNTDADNTENVDGLQIDGSTGVITVTFTPAAGGGTPGSDSISLVPDSLPVLTLGSKQVFAPPPTRLAWTCTSTMDARLVPVKCR